jgi:hypothetical protein
MKNTSSKGIILALIIVISMIISSVGSIGMSTENNIESIKPSLLEETCSISSVDIASFDNSENILVAGTDENESYPAMVTSGAKALVAYEYIDDTGTKVLFKHSSNNGKTWSTAYSFNFEHRPNCSSPSLAIDSFGQRAYGAFISDYNGSGEIIEVIFNSLNNPSTEWDASPVDWTENGFYNFKTSDITYYAHGAPNIPYMVALIGSTTLTGAECQDSPMFFYVDYSQPAPYTIAWDPDLNDCSNISIDTDGSSNIIYGVCEIKNGSKTDLFFFNDDPVANGAGWGETTSISNKTLSSTESLMHPQIFVQDGEIFIVAETDTNKIVLFNSSNNGNNWTMKYITDDILPPSTSPSNPQIFANETMVSCTFIESGNLSLTTSNNSGLNWTDIVQINNQNNSVVSGYRFTSFSEIDNYIWTDNRNGKGNDIYALIGRPLSIDLAIVPSSVNLTYEIDTEINGKRLITTKNWIVFTVENRGTAYLQNVYVNITYTCEGESPVETKFSPYLITYLPAKDQVTIKQPLFRLNIQQFFRALIDFAGIQRITITIQNEDDASPADNTYIFGEDIESLYSEIFPKLSFLENFLKPFKPDT